jgi:uncharacterized protein YkwD
MPEKKPNIPFLTGLFLIFFAIPVISQESIKAEIINEINKARVNGCQCGEEKMPPAVKLEWSEQLEKAAAKHAVDMYDHGNLDHIGTDGSDLGDRISATGYLWSMVGENISWGFTETEDVVQGWIESSGHCKNMMNPTFTEMGAARKGEYWVLELAAGK